MVSKNERKGDGESKIFQGNIGDKCYSELSLQHTPTLLCPIKAVSIKFQTYFKILITKMPTC